MPILEQPYKETRRPRPTGIFSTGIIVSTGTAFSIGTTWISGEFKGREQFLVGHRSPWQPSTRDTPSRGHRHVVTQLKWAQAAARAERALEFEHFIRALLNAMDTERFKWVKSLLIESGWAQEGKNGRFEQIREAYAEIARLAERRRTNPEDRELERTINEAFKRLRSLQEAEVSDIELRMEPARARLKDAEARLQSLEERLPKKD